MPREAAAVVVAKEAAEATSRQQWQERGHMRNGRQIVVVARPQRRRTSLCQTRPIAGYEACYFSVGLNSRNRHRLQ